MKKIVLIDGNYWLFSSFYATYSQGFLMHNKDGVYTNAVYGFANRLDAILRQEPDAVLVAFDAKGKTFRSELLEDYKGTRKETPMELKSQFPLVREYLTAKNVCFYELEGYEGDDIIGTVASIAKNEGYAVDIYTGDKDMMQLIDDQVHVFKRNTKTKSDDEITPIVFYEKYQLEPSQMKDLLGLMGDTADNIAGVHGIGEKGALKLLTQYQTIENIYDHIEEIKGKTKEKLIDGKEGALLSKKIATIITDAPITLNLEDTLVKAPEESRLRQFYETYEMTSFLKRMDRVPKKKQEVFVVHTMPSITHPFALVSGVYMPNYHKSFILGYAIYDGQDAYYISYEDALKDQTFMAVLSNPDIEKYTYNIKKELNASLWNGVTIQGFAYDLQLASYIINPSLEDDYARVLQAYDYFEVDSEEDVFGKGAKRHVPEEQILANYYGNVAKGIYETRPSVIERLKKDQQYHLYQDVEVPLTFILAKMEYQGVKVSVDTLKKQEKDLKEKIKTLEDQIIEAAGEPFNIASPKQLGEILFEKMKLPGAKKTKTGYSTAADVLEKIVDVHPIIPAILQYRTLTKLLSTYIIGLQDQVFPDGKIHTIYNQALTQTGRLSSQDPNLQNIPIRYEEGKLIRQAFVPTYDYILSYDYSQIELRVVASLSHCQSLIDAFNHEVDVHTKTASDIFNVPMEMVNSDLRRHAKAINFGIIYGMSDFGLASQVGVSVPEAKRFIDAYFNSYPEIQTLMSSQIKQAEELGYVTTILNRRRYIPEIHDKNYMKREAAKRLAMNSPIQGSAADLLKLAMIKVDQAMKAAHLESKMILQVHDELVFDVKENELETMQQLVVEAMKDAFDMEVTLKAEGSYGKTWYDLK